jgi:hypothetical protein
MNRRGFLLASMAAAAAAQTPRLPERVTGHAYLEHPERWEVIPGSYEINTDVMWGYRNG